MKKITAIVFIGLILCCFVGIASASTTTEERVTNGDFSNGFTGWNKVVHNGTTYASLANETVGSKSCLGYGFFTPLSNADVPYSYVEQTIDLTDVNTLYWKTRQGYNSYSSGDFYTLYIYKDGEQIASYTYSNLGSSWTQRSYDVSSISGEVTIRFKGSVDYRPTEGESEARSYIVAFYITDVSAPAIYTNPEITGKFVSGSTEITKPVFIKSNTVTVKYSFSKGSYSSSTATINWGDSKTSTLSAGTDLTVTHTYSSEGSYTPVINVYNSGSVLASTTLTTAYVISVDFSADTTSADPGTAILFTATATIPSDVSITGYSWNFGDSSTGTGIQLYHTYQSSGTYDVSLTITLSAGSGYTATVTKEDYINTASQTVSFNVTSVTSGSSVKATWSLRDVDYPYVLNVYPSSNTGERTSYTAIASHTITSASDTSYTFTVGTAGYYSAYIEKSSTVITRTITPVNVYTLISLTVNVANNGAPYVKEQTTVKLYTSGGTLLQTKNTVLQSSGSYSDSVIFSNINTGDYYVTISASNQSLRTSPTLALTDSYTLTMDFTLGSSDTSTNGVGSQYATTFVTFRTQDSGTGRYISDVQIIATAVQPTNAWEYFANLFGASLGEVIQAMTLSGTSDSDGRITFAMYQNVRYNLNITYNKNGKSYHEDRSFQQSSLSGEYLISIPLTEIKTEKITENLVTSVNTTDTAIITNFTDYSGTVTNCTITVYEKNGDERQNLNMSVTYTNPLQGIPQLQTFTPSEPSGQSYIVSFVIHSTEYGTKTQEYGVTFSGVAVKLGDIPSEWYIWISFAILLMTGAVATFVNSRHFAIVVCIVATLLYFAGWLNQLGTIAPVALVICYVLTIVYYIANNHNGGV